MPSKSIRYEVLIASPGDVKVERDVVDEVIRDWNSSHKATGIFLQSLRWELDAIPELGDRAQGVINKQLADNADFLIALFSTRLGTPTGVAASGTAEEIERLRSMGKHVMVYFSNAPVPREHDPEQLKLLNEYKRGLMQQGLCSDFADENDLRRKLSRALASKMSTEFGVPKAAPTESNSGLARLIVRAGRKGRSSDVDTVNLVVEIENVSSASWIREYSATVSIPAPCLTFASATYPSEIRSDIAGHRKFRHTQQNFAGVRIHPGDRLQVFATELGIDQLRMRGTHLEGDVNAVLAEEISVVAIVDGERFTAEKPVSEFFPRTTESRVMEALESPTIWTGPRPMTGGGDAAVRADELAGYLRLSKEEVNETLARLEQNGRVANIGGHLADPTPRWHTTRRF